MDIHFFSFDKDLFFTPLSVWPNIAPSDSASACANQTAELQNFAFVQRKTDIVNDDSCP